MENISSLCGISHPQPFRFSMLYFVSERNKRKGQIDLKLRFCFQISITLVVLVDTHET